MVPKRAVAKKTTKPVVRSAAKKTTPVVPVKLKSKTKAAKNTRQIWISRAVHDVLSKRAQADRRRLRVTAELLLAEALGFESLDVLEAMNKSEKLDGTGLRTVLERTPAEEEKSFETGDVL